MVAKLEFKRHTGKVIVSGFENILSVVLLENEKEESFRIRVLKAEAYLNDKVSLEVHRRFNIAVRFHL